MKILPRANRWLSYELKERCMRVEPATIGHHLHFGFMDARIKSLLPNVKVVGTAFTVKTTANDSIMVHKAVSLADEGDVLVIDRNGDTRHACVGEIVAYAASVKKIAAIIIDGAATDVQAIRQIGLPVFAAGLSPLTTKLIGKSGEINTAVHCGGVVVNPGDLIIADDNGVLVLPQDPSFIEQVLEKAEASEANEPKIKERLRNGEDLASITMADQLLREQGVI